MGLLPCTSENPVCEGLSSAVLLHVDTLTSGYPALNNGTENTIMAILVLQQRKNNFSICSYLLDYFF